MNNRSLPVSETIDGPQRQLIEDLASRGCLGDPRNYYCPAQRQPERSFSDGNFNSGMIGYYYYGALGPGANARVSRFLRSGVSWPRRLDRLMDAKTWVMSDIWISAVPTVHRGYRKGVNYLTLDGSVGFVGQSPRQAFH